MTRVRHIVLQGAVLTNDVSGAPSSVSVSAKPSSPVTRSVGALLSAYGATCIHHRRHARAGMDDRSRYEQGRCLELVWGWRLMVNQRALQSFGRSYGVRHLLGAEIHEEKGRTL